MKSGWIDAHIHLTDERMRATLDQTLAEAANAGIQHYVLGGIEPSEWEKQKELARNYPGRIFPSFGLHPWWVARASLSECDRALECLLREVKPVGRACTAIGETGLDFHPNLPAESHDTQRRLFRAQIRIALDANLPLVLHVVRAHPDALQILKDELRDALKVGYTGIIHSFSGDLATARAYLALGLVPSISSPVITREKGRAFENLVQTVVTLSATEFVLETDAPDQPPAGEPGPNQPLQLIRLAERIGKLRGETADAVLNQSTKNLRRIFSLAPATEE
ncbi:MAG: TatD family hydrolase [Cryobacterium sp.]|nr:TatD family hydrolase [Oligoflexia bacterium]